MKCKDCQVEMEKGYLIFHGNLWKKGKPTIRGFVKIFNGGENTTTYHCPNCKKIELYTEDTK